MRDIGILLFGVFLGIWIQRVAGDTVAKMISKSTSAYEAFRK